MEAEARVGGGNEVSKVMSVVCCWWCMQTWMVGVKGHPMRAEIVGCLREVKGGYLEEIDLSGAELFNEVHGPATLRTSPEWRSFNLVCCVSCWELSLEQAPA